jgi:filamentous hemagglutinin family protein
MAQRAPALWRELLLATTCLVAASPSSYAASAQPTGFTVAAGQGSVSAPNPTTTLIRQSTDKAIFEWSSFSTSRGFSVVFQQPNSGSIALNRVRGPRATQFDGSLQANGQVWIVNPNGVFFGQGAQVNVGGLVATTADIRNQDFLSGNYSFSGASGAAIVNEGQIRAANGGSVVLAGAHVRNDGLIQADLGTVQLAAGKSFAVDLNGDKLVRFQITAAVDQTPLDANGKPVDALITNTGTLSAAGGKVLLTARAAKGIVDNVINTTGIVEATSVRQVNGEILLDGGDGGAVKVAGSLDASGKQPGESGGTVLVAGGTVGLLDNARIDVSGDAGGGTALIGGGAHGVGPLLNADTMLVAARATITADALTRGDGGNVVVWSDRYTAVAGSISARGGSIAGNGGFVETSSHGDLRIASSASVAVDARKGKGGQWLLDPRNATIGNSNFGGASDTSGNSIIGIPTSDDASIAASVIDAALNSGTSVTLTTGSTGLQAGNITVAAAVAKTGGGDATLTLTAAGGITVAQSITSSTGALSVNLVAGTNILVNAGILTNGGNFTANGAHFANNAAISTIAPASANGDTNLTAANGMSIGGTILTGQFTATVTGAGGAFSLVAGTTINATGNVAVSNLGGSLTVAGSLIGNGITLSAGSFVQMATGTIASTGNNFGSNDLSISADSISLSGADRSITGNGTITLAPLSDSTTVGIGTASGQFHLTNSEGNVFDGFQQFIVGKADRGTADNHGTTSLTLGGAQSFDNQDLVFQAGLNGAVTLAPDAAITAAGHKLTFATGAGGSFTQSNGATLTTLGNTQVRIGADAITLNGPVGSLGGLGQIGLRGATDTTTIGVGTGAGTLNVSQATIDRLSHFAVLGIGDGDHSTGLVTIGGAANLGTTTGFGGQGAGASVMLNADAHITTSAPSGSAVGFFSGTGGSVTQTSGATINAGASTLVIAADQINLAGPPGSLSGSQGVVIAAGHGGDNTMSVGTGGGALVVTQGLIDNLQSFSSLTLGGLPAILPVSGAINGTTLVTVGGAITARIATTIAAVAPGGQVVLKPGTSLNSAGKAIGFLGAVVLGGVDAATGTFATIDTTQGGVPGGGAISFGGTVDGSFSRQQALTLVAGGGDIAFNDTAGGGVQLGNFNVNSVRNFTATLTPAAAAVAQAFSAASFGLTGSGSVTMPSGIRTRFGDNQAVATTSGAITVSTTGAVTIGSFNSDPNLVTGVLARGADATTIGAVASNGGTISITGSSINLPGFLTARGGKVKGTATGTGGNSGSVTLTATGGDVVAGIDNTNDLFSGGGSSLRGSGGNAASFTINAAGSIILPGGIAANGGNAGGGIGNGGNAGALSLTATTGNIVIGGADATQPLSTSGGAAAAYGGAAVGTGGAGKAITMIAGGSVTVYGPIQTISGVGTQSGDASGALTVAAGGNVNLGISSSSAPAVNTSGHATAFNNGGAGNAGAINITGANIVLLNGASANGGNSISPAAAKGGDAAPINLTATNGLVLVGQVGSGPGSAGNLTLSAVGGFSGSGNGGAGADVAVSSATMLLAGIETAGGGTVIGGGHPGGKAGKITLTASANLGDAVVLFGQDAAGGIRGTLDASGGAGTDAGHQGQSGTITIQGSAAGAALNGSADIRLQASSNPATHQGSHVVINGGNNLKGPIVSTTAGVETLTINGASTPIGLATPLILASGIYGAVTAGSAIFTGGTVVANDIFITGASTLSGSTAIDTSAANGFIALNQVNAASAGVQSLTLTAGSGFVVLGDSIGNTTALGNFSATGGSVLLPGTIKTAGGTVTIGGAAVLQNSLAIDTTNAGASSGGATITFAGTLDGLVPRADNLTLTAGSSGDVNFNGRVGVNNVGLGNTGFDPNGARLGDVQINGAQNVNLNMAFGTNGDGFTANSFAIGTTSTAGAASLTASSFIGVKPSNGTPGVITINTTGDVAVAQGLGANGSSGSGDPGGNVTVISGGNVSIGTALVPSFTSNFSINARGADTTAANQPAGHGGTVVVTAKSINLPGGVLARGGDSKFAGDFTTSAGGAGGSITLTATAGNVTVGTASSGTAFSASARGGNSLSGSGGTGGAVSISGTTLFLTGAFAQGGDTLVNIAGAGGTGGNVTLTASAAGGDAVVIYGNSGAPGATTFGTVLSRGGQIGVTSFASGTSPEVGGTVDGAGGDITIQGGPSLTPLSGVVRLATSADPGALNGGSSITFSSSGGAAAAYGGAAYGGAPGTGGTTRILGAIVGTTVNTENLRFGAQNGTVIVDGPIGSVTPLSTLAIGGSGSTVNFGAVSLGTAFLDQRSSGSVAFGGMLTTPDLTMAPGSTVALALNGGTNITDRLTLSGTVSAGALLFNIPTTLVGDTTISATADGGPLGLGTVDGTHVLTLLASGAVSLGTVGGQDPLAAINVTGSSIALGSVFTQVGQNYTGATTIAAGGTLTTAGGAITFNSAVRLGDAGPSTNTLVTLDTSNGAISLGTVDGAQNLTLNAGTGTVTFNGALGSETPLAALNLVAGNGTVINQSVFTSGATTLTAGAGGGLSVGTGVVGTLVVDNAALGHITGGGLRLQTTGTGAITVDGVTAAATAYTGAVTLASAGVTAFVNHPSSFAGALTVTNGGTMVLAAGAALTASGGFGQNGAGAVTLDDNLTTTNQAIGFASAITLGGTVALSSGGGAITLPAINGAQTLTLNPGAGTVVINGTIGGVAKPTGLVLTGGGAVTIASVSALGTLDLSGKTAGSVTFPGSVNIDALTTSANPYSIAFNGGGTIGDPIFSNTGTLTFDLLMNVPGGLLAAGPSSTTLNGILSSDNNPIVIQNLVVTGASAIQTGTAPVILGAVDQGANSLVIAGGGTGVNADLFFGPWTGTGVRLVEPGTAGASVGLAGAAGDFTIDANSLHILASGGPSQVKIGRDDFSGTLTANAFTFDAPLTMWGSSISLTDTLTKNSGNLTLNATGGINGSLALANTVSLAVASGGNVQLQNAGSLQLGNVSASGALGLTAGGAITQLAGTSVIAVGTTLAAGSGNDITLTNAGNNFDAGGGAASLIVTSGRNVQIADGNSLQLGNVTTAGTLSVTANGVITQAADTAVVAAGTTLAAGSTHDIILANAGNDFDLGGGAATLVVTSGRNVQLQDANALQFGNVTASGTLSVTTGGAITQAAGTALLASGTTLAAGSAGAGGGHIALADPGSADIVLTNAGNDFDLGGGAARLVVTRGNNAQLRDANSMAGTLTLDGGLSVSATSAVFIDSIVAGVSGAAAAGHATTFGTLGSGPYTLNGVSFDTRTAAPPPPPPPPPPLPKTVQPAPTHTPPPIVDLPPPPPTPPAPPAPPPAPTVAQPDAPPRAPAPTPALVQALGGEAQAAAALANVVPQAGSGTGTPDTGSSTPTENDKLTQTISQPLNSQPPSQPAPKKPSTTSVVINGMLNKFQPSTSAPPPSGTTPGGQNFSSWGNEAFW